MSSQTPQITQLIVNDIANSQLSSYQIAYRYHISKTSVDHIGRSHVTVDYLGSIPFYNVSSPSPQKVKINTTMA